MARLLSIALWFNPFVFAVEGRRRLAAELDCDRRALAGLSDGGVRSYARALLNAAGSSSGSGPVVGFGVAPRKAIEMRLKSIVNPSPKPKRRRTVIRMVGLGVAAVALCGVQAAQANGGLTPPDFTAVILEGRQTSDFGPRFWPDLNSNQFHRGHDIAAPTGTPIHAPAAGEVTFAGFGYAGAAAWGYVVMIDHGAGWSTFYAHLEGSSVEVGDRVRPGQAFATVGNTGRSLGPHLHVEVHHNGEFLDPADHLPGLARLTD